MADTLSNNQFTVSPDQNGVERVSVNSDLIAPDWQKELDAISRMTGLGDLKRAHFNMLRGINFRGIGNPVVSNMDNVGMTFFTRPRLALAYDNLTVDRKLSQLGTQDQLTLQRAVRCYLDHVGETRRNVITPLVDPRLPFISVLTNNLLSLSGWPDPTMSYWTSQAGNMKEQIALIDDTYQTNEVFQLQANFSNTAGDPISLLMDTWCTYASMVYLGQITPYPDAIATNRVDYQTRIYQFVLDPGRRFIQKVAITGAAFPTSTPMGASFNFDSSRPFVGSTQQVNIPFTCIGAQYNDPIIYKEFNELCADWYSPMGQIADNATTGKSTGPSGLRQLTVDEAQKYNYYSLPHINLYTNELQWWVTNEEYAQFK